MKHPYKQEKEKVSLYSMVALQNQAIAILSELTLKSSKFYNFVIYSKKKEHNN